MSQQFQSSQNWRGGRSEALWLSSLVDTMEEVAHSEQPAFPCDSRVMAALFAQLAPPTQVGRGSFASRFSLRN